MASAAASAAVKHSKTQVKVLSTLRSLLRHVDRTLVNCPQGSGGALSVRHVERLERASHEEGFGGIKGAAAVGETALEAAARGRSLNDTTQW